jgi:hypothetical protein
MHRKFYLLIAVLTMIAAQAHAAPWKPAVGASFEWMLSNSLSASLPKAQVIDIDGFEATAMTVSRIHRAGKRAVCYINVGAWENWRPDKGKFPASVIGKAYPGWAGEKFLDIRQIKLLAPIMRARFDMCKSKGFDAIEPDNLDSHQQPTGFPITRAQQIAYNKWIAAEAHARGLSIGLKNVPDLLPELKAHFDWALLEDCYDQGWCSTMSPLIAAGKAVFSVEYTDNNINFTKYCNRMKVLKFTPLYKHRNLDSWSRHCP